MPGRDVAAKRYAQAVFALAREDGAFDRWRADLQALRVLAADPTVGAFLLSTKVPEERKFAALEQGLSGSHPHALNLAKLLVRKNRVGIIDEIADAFEELLNAERGLVIAQVTTAVPLTDAGRSSIAAAVRRATGAATVELREAVSRDILGGAVLQIGDHLVDGSVRTRLQNLRSSIAGSVR